MKAEPIGSELSINIKAVPELKSAKVGDVCKFEIKGTVIGKHTHTVGKTIKMVDVRIDSIEYDEESDEDDAE